MSTASNKAAVSPWALENGHKIARLLQYHEGPPYNIPAILDQALAPVRECLDNAIAAMNAAMPYVPRDLGIALRERSKAAQQLYERLKIQ